MKDISAYGIYYSLWKSPRDTLPPLPLLITSLHYLVKIYTPWFSPTLTHFSICDFSSLCDFGHRFGLLCSTYSWPPLLISSWFLELLSMSPLYGLYCWLLGKIQLFIPCCDWDGVGFFWAAAYTMPVWIVGATPFSVSLKPWYAPTPTCQFF